MKYLSCKEMQELDRRTIEEYGIPGMVLMENAGRSVALEALKMLKQPTKATVSVICGTGNNGGDGFVAARHLFNSGVKVKVFYLGNLKEALTKTGDAITNLKIALKMKIEIKEVSRTPAGTFPPTLRFGDVVATPRSAPPHLIIDAIFGIGLTRPVEGALKELIESINRSKIPVIAVDVPSGLDCDKGIPLGTAIKATKTITFGAAKVGFRNPLAKKYLGELIVTDISIPKFLS